MYHLYVEIICLSTRMKADAFFNVSYYTMYHLYVEKISIDVIVSYVTNLYLLLHHLNFLYLHLNALALQSEIIYSIEFHKG